MSPADEMTFLRTLQRNIRYFEVLGRAPLGTEWLRLKVVARMAAVALVLAAGGAKAQEHRHHPVADMPLHEQFYSKWYMPDQPSRSCCNKADCYPTEARFRNGMWQARRREDGRWLTIPANKVERNRDNPDGRNHLCAPPPGASYPPDTVFCFALGGGT